MPQSFLANALALRHMRDQRAMQQQAQEEREQALSQVPPEMRAALQLGLKPQEYIQGQMLSRLMAGMQGRAPQVDPSQVAPWTPPPGPMQSAFPPEFLQDVGVAEAQGIANQIAQQQMMGGLPQEWKDYGLTQGGVARALLTGDMKEAYGVAPTQEMMAPYTPPGSREFYERYRTRWGEKHPIVGMVDQPYTDPVTGAQEIRRVPTLGGMPVPGGTTWPTRGPGLAPADAAQMAALDAGVEAARNIRSHVLDPKTGELQRWVLAWRTGDKVGYTPHHTTMYDSQMEAIINAIAMQAVPGMRGDVTGRLKAAYSIKALADDAQTAEYKLAELEKFLGRIRQYRGLPQAEFIDFVSNVTGEEQAQQGPLYHNPQTGEYIRWNKEAGKWEPAERR